VNHLYSVVEEVRDIFARRLGEYGVESIYRAAVYAFVSAALQRKVGRREILRPLEEKIPPPLLAYARRELIEKLGVLLERIEGMLSKDRQVLAHGEADLGFVVDSVKREIGEASYVLAYDCMSLIEQLVISAYLKASGARTVFLSTVFINPLGLTRFMTQQLVDPEHATLRGVARYVANRLGAKLYAKNSYIDKMVHEIGALGIEEFINKVEINRMASEILETVRAINGWALIFSDHGYDVVASLQDSHLYVVHGFRKSENSAHIPLLLLSRISFFMGIHGSR